MDTCVYVKCINESHFLNAFVDHYIKIGFGMIYVLFKEKDDSYVLPEKYRNKVTIRKVKNGGNNLFDKYKHIIDNDKYHWVFPVELNHFLVLHKDFTNINEIVKFYVNNDFKVNMIQFGGLWTHKFSLDSESIKSILSKRKLIIGKDLNSDKIWYRSMIKTKYMHYLNDSKIKVKEVDNYLLGYNKKIHTIKNNNTVDYTDISHHKVNQHTYKDGFILELYTRNACDVFSKIKHIKNMSNKKDVNYGILKNILEQIDENVSNITDDLLINMVESNENNLKFPFKSLHYTKLNNSKVLEQIIMPESDLPIFSSLSKPENIKFKTLNTLGYIFDRYFVNQ